MQLAFNGTSFEDFNQTLIYTLFNSYRHYVWRCSLPFKNFGSIFVYLSQISKEKEICNTTYPLAERMLPTPGASAREEIYSGE